jgi:uncharacterized membrane protein
MSLLIIGLIVFLAAHSVRIYAEPWRGAVIARIGPNAWKGLYSLVSLAGFVLLAWGYGRARVGAAELWVTPAWLRYPAWLLMMLSFVLIAAAYVPRNRIKTIIGHPLVASVKLWAFAHLLTNSRAADLVLFGAFLIWSVVEYRSARRRDRLAGTPAPEGSWVNAAVASVIGLAVWLLFLIYLHSWLIGVPIV